MGKYYNPPEDIKTIGRYLGSNPNFDYLSIQLEDNEVLVGVYDRGIFKIAVYIPDARELEEFESQYRSGMLISHDFFAVHKWW